MNYGQFLYGWSEYSTADLTTKDAVSLTASGSQFSASVEKILVAVTTISPQLTVGAEVYRVRDVDLSSDATSDTVTAPIVIREAITLMDADSATQGDTDRLRTVSLSADGSASVSGDIYRIQHIDLSSDAQSALTAQGNFLSNVSASLDGVSQVEFIPNVTYSADFTVNANNDIIFNIEYLYVDLDKDNESWSQVTPDDGTWQQITKGSESWTEI